jgi:hypothetical protein
MEVLEEEIETTLVASQRPTCREDRSCPLGAAAPAVVALRNCLALSSL